MIIHSQFSQTLQNRHSEDHFRLQLENANQYCILYSLGQLSEEYTYNPKLHLIEIDLTNNNNNMGTEDPKPAVKLPDNTYKYIYIILYY